MFGLYHCSHDYADFIHSALLFSLLFLTKKKTQIYNILV
jgi:hypothetical protein